MRKNKVKSIVKKRFKVTKNGKILHSPQYAGHRKSHKSRQQIRRQRAYRVLGDAESKVVRKFLGI